MISLQSIAVAATGAGLAPSDEESYFRFALRTAVCSHVVVAPDYDFLAYVEPQWVP